jgi:hypothetical protein
LLTARVLIKFKSQQIEQVANWGMSSDLWLIVAIIVLPATIGIVAIYRWARSDHDHSTHARTRS